MPPTSDRETCPACGKPRAAAGLRNSVSLGLGGWSPEWCWADPQRQLCQDVDPRPDGPALRAAALAVAERGRLIASLVARAESAERDRDHYQKCAEAVSAGMLAEAAARLAAEQQRDALAKAVFGPWNDWGDRWAFRPRPGAEPELAGSEADAAAGVARAVERATGEGGGVHE